MRKIKIAILALIIISSFCLTITPYATLAERAPPAGVGPNKAPVVTINSPTNGETVTGTVTISVTVTDDKDTGLVAKIYIDGVYITQSNSYSWNTANYADGSHTIKADATDSGGKTGSDQISVTVNNGGGGDDPTPPPGGDGIVKHWAVIVGISDYKAISDLNYCDEDASDWYNFLHARNYENIKVYGDGHTSDFPKYDGLATEYNVKNALINMVNSADADDVISFISSGHGSGNGRGSSFLCMWDYGAGENGQDGALYDTELQNILKVAVANKIFVFLDHCYAGGFGPELMNMPNSANVLLLTTCTEKGYGYDSPTHNNGLWTYYFLEYSWIDHYGGSKTVALEDVFGYASAAYPKRAKDAPQIYDGSTGTSFILW